jgi:hypothetical protein
MEYDSPLVRDFVRFCSPVITSLRCADHLQEAISNAASEGCNCDSLARRFNHLNDGNACERFLLLVEQILEEKQRGVRFFQGEEEELLQSVRRYPFLPFPFQHLIKFFFKNGNYMQVDRWLEEYLQRFSDPFPLLRDLSKQCLHQGRASLARHYLTIYSMLKPLDFTLLQMYKSTFPVESGKEEENLHAN